MIVASTIDIRQFKTHLSKLLARVSAGEELVIAKAGKPIARLMPISPSRSEKRIPGIDKGKIWMSPDFDLMSEQELQNWYPVVRS